MTDEDLILSEHSSSERLVEMFTRHWIRKKDALEPGNPPVSGPDPWDVLNEMLDESGFKYRCNSPPKSLQQKYILELRDAKTNVRVEPWAMSSGERVLLRLFFLVLSARSDARLPRLVILDEPDAHLHPEMVQKFIRVVSDVLVTKGVRVIMSTHSPTTVAVCPEEALFEMLGSDTPIEQPRFRKVSRGRAIGLLTAGVPALRVEWQHKRQVFVEAKADEETYSALYESLKNRLGKEVGLSFIASGLAKSKETGDCVRVKNFAQSLKETGTVHGILDWDLTAKSKDNVWVLAEGTRYSLENCVFDPLVVIAMLCQLQAKTGGPWPSFVSLGSLSNEKWQELVDRLFTTLRKSSEDEADRVPCTAIQGPSVMYERWYLRFRGHDLEARLCEAFPELNAVGRGQGAGAMMLATARKIGAEYPQLFPRELLEIMQKIQDAPITAAEAS